MQRVLLLILSAVLLAACGTQPEELPDPIEVLNTAADYFQQAETFKIEVLQEGAPYFIETDVTEGAIAFRRAVIDYQAPDTLQGDVDARLFGVPYAFSILARGENQWVNLPAIGWTDAYYFAYGFNPQDLIAEETGFQAALNALIDIEMVGRESVDGISVYHMTGRADGTAVRDLLVGLIEPENEVVIDVYVKTEDNVPLRLTITMPGTETEEVPEPTKWIVDVYDFNESVTIDGPTVEDDLSITVEPSDNDIAATEDAVE